MDLARGGSLVGLVWKDGESLDFLEPGDLLWIAGEGGGDVMCMC